MLGDTNTLVAGTMRAGKLSMSRRTLWLLVAAAILFLPCGVINNGDGAARYAQTRAMLRGSLSIPLDLSMDRNGERIGGILVGSHGRLYSKYGIGCSAVWLPTTAVAFGIGRLTNTNADALAGFAISFINPLLVLLTAVSLRWILRRLGLEGPSAFVVLLYLFGCSTLPYANTAFSEPLVGLILLWSCVAPVLWPTAMGSALAGFGMTAVTLIKPELVLLTGCMIPLLVSAKDPWRKLPTFGAFAIVGVGSFLLLNWLCRGSPLRFSYGEESSRFHAPAAGLRGYFLGLDKNILLFNPALLFSVAGLCRRQVDQRWRALRWSTMSIWAIYVPFYASWWAWGGGLCFGPRFFQSFIPVTLLFSGIIVHKPERLLRPSLALLYLITIALIPLQFAGLEVKGEQATHVSEVSGRPEPVSHLQLLRLKLWRGIYAPEVYRRSDFVSLKPAEPDTVIDFQSKRTFQYLDNWWLIAIANHVRRVSIPSGADVR